MKKIFLAVMLVFFASMAGAEQGKLIFSDTFDPDLVTYGWDNEKVSVIFEIEGYITVKTRNNTLRIYPCGKVEKLDWKEINPNEDKPQVFTDEIRTWYQYNGTLEMPLNGMITTPN